MLSLYWAARTASQTAGAGRPRRIVAEKTANFSILFLFSIGVTKGKWGSRVNPLLEFKRDYDANAPLSRAMPALVQGNPSAYGIFGLRDLASRMFTALCEAKIPELLQAAYDVEPQVLLTPADALSQSAAKPARSTS